jgi:Flp pilus assembly protein TadB
MKISLIISTVIFIAVMLALKFLILPPFIHSYGVVGAIAFIAVIFSLAMWLENRDIKQALAGQRSAQETPTQPKKTKEELDAWAKKIGDDLARPKSEIIDVEFTVIEPEMTKVAQPMWQGEPSGTLMSTLIASGIVIVAIVLGYFFLAHSPELSSLTTGDQMVEKNGLTKATNDFLRTLPSDKR